MSKLPLSGFLVALVSITSVAPLSLAQSSQQLKVVNPGDAPERASAAALDTEKFELGAYLGLLSVEDFNTNPVLGLAGNYYLTPSWMLQVAYGRSETDRSEAEGNSDFNAERDFSYLSFSGGYRVLEGRSFRGKKRKFNTGLYLMAGLEQVDFAEDSNVGLVIGASYRTVLTDLVTFNLDFKDHIVNRDFFGEDKMTQNIEFSAGINLMF